MASPPKPWERPGSGVSASPASSTPVSQPASSIPSPTTATAASSTPSASTASAPPVPDRPASLTSAVNQNAAAYSRVGAMGASPYGASPYNSYGSFGSAYSSPYSSPYSRFGGGYGGMGSGMYGGYGGYGGGMYGGMYGGGMGGMPGGPNDPNSLTNRFNNSTAATFQMLEGIVTAFGGFAQMLESTYMATHSSFFAMVSVAEQFGNLRDTLGSILGIFTLLRWIRTLIAKLTGRPPPADATALTPAAFARFEGRAVPLGPDGQPTGPPRASRKPLLFFVLAAFGLPYLMSKAIKTLAASHEEEEQRRMQELQQPVDPSKLEYCRLMYDFLPQPATGVELEARKGDLVAVLSKTDPTTGQPSEWWQCRARDGRQGYLPSTYLEVLRRAGQQEVKKIKAADDVSSRTNSITSEKSPAAQMVKPEEGKKEFVTPDGMQRGHFYS